MKSHVELRYFRSIDFFTTSSCEQEVNNCEHILMLMIYRFNRLLSTERNSWTPFVQVDFEGNRLRFNSGLYLDVLHDFFWIWIKYRISGSEDEPGLARFKSESASSGSFGRNESDRLRGIELHERGCIFSPRRSQCRTDPCYFRMAWCLCSSRVSWLIPALDLCQICSATDLVPRMAENLWLGSR